MHVRTTAAEGCGVCEQYLFKYSHSFILRSPRSSPPVASLPIFQTESSALEARGSGRGVRWGVAESSEGERRREVELLVTTVQVLMARMGWMGWGVL